MSPQTYAFTQLKSFGDLVITVAALRAVPAPAVEQCRLLISPHLDALARALKPVCPVEVLDLDAPDVPALFDVKKCGIPAAVGSLINVRKALTKAAPGAALVMERGGLRERLISSGRTCLTLQPASNVYAGYAAFLRNLFGAEPQYALTARNSSPVIPVKDALNPAGVAKVAICPLSRVAAKQIPPSLVSRAATICRQAGLASEVLLLQGDPLDGYQGTAVRTVPRSFPAYLDALSDYAAVISADSLPAHLAEYCGVGVFVMSPVSNAYWLPQQAFACGYSARFGEPDRMEHALQGFLQTAIQHPTGPETA